MMSIVAQRHGWAGTILRIQDLAFHKRSSFTVALTLRQRRAAAMHRRGFPPGLDAHPGRFPAADRLDSAPMIDDVRPGARYVRTAPTARPATTEPSLILKSRSSDSRPSTGSPSES